MNRLKHGSSVLGVKYILGLAQSRYQFPYIYLNIRKYDVVLLEKRN